MNYSYIDAYKRHLAFYSSEQLIFISSPGVWSLGQLLDHVIAVAEEYLDHIDQCAVAQMEQPLGKTEAGGKLFRLGDFPPVKIKLPDSPEFIPDNTRSKEDLDSGLDAVAERIRMAESNLGTHNPRCKILHAGYGWLNAQEWHAMIGMHFRHHLRQQAYLEQAAGVVFTNNGSSR